MLQALTAWPNVTSMLECYNAVRQCYKLWHLDKIWHCCQNITWEWHSVKDFQNVKTRMSERFQTVRRWSEVYRKYSLAGVIADTQWQVDYITTCPKLPSRSLREFHVVLGHDDVTAALSTGALPRCLAVPTPPMPATGSVLVISFSVEPRTHLQAFKANIRVLHISVPDQCTRLWCIDELAHYYVNTIIETSLVKTPNPTSILEYKLASSGHAHW